MRVFLVDSSPVFREGLKSVVSGSSGTVVGEANSCQGLLEKVEDCDLITLDGQLDSLSLLQSLENIRKKGTPPYTLILTGRTETTMSSPALPS